MTDREKLRAYRGQACRAANGALDYAERWEGESYKERIPSVPEELIDALILAAVPQVKNMAVPYRKIEAALKDIQETVGYIRTAPMREDLSWESMKDSARVVFETAREISTAELSEQFEKTTAEVKNS